MTKFPLPQALGALCALVYGGHAAAHYEYFDLNQGVQVAGLTADGRALVGNDLPITDPAFWTARYQSLTSSGETWSNYTGSYESGYWTRSLHVVNVDSTGWTDGQRTDPAAGAFLLGDSHKVNFANFTLKEAALVTLTFVDDNAGSGFSFNPSMSLYRGNIVYQAHDDLPVDPLNPKLATPPFSKTQNARDNGTTADSQGITSAFRDTVHNSGVYYGQFNALGDYSQGNAAGFWSAVAYLGHATGYFNPDGTWAGNAGSNTLEMLLDAGSYTLAFSGNAQALSYGAQRSAEITSPYGAISNLGGTLHFSVAAAPVPEPHTWAMLLAGLAAVGFAARRRQTRQSL